MGNWLEQFGGGIREEYDITILSAFFAPDATYQDGSTFLLTLIGVDEEGEPVTEKYNAAKTSEWASYDGGRTIVPIGQVKKLNRTSMYGHMVDYAVKGGAGEVLGARGDSNNATTWIGLKFHMKAVEISFGKKIDPQMRVMPVQFLGVDNEAVTAPTPAMTVGVQLPMTATANGSAPSPTPATPTTNPAIQTLIALAKTKPDFQSFRAEALFVEGVMTDDELLTQVTDPDSFYALHHA